MKYVCGTLAVLFELCTLGAIGEDPPYWAGVYVYGAIAALNSLVWLHIYRRSHHD